MSGDWRAEAVIITGDLAARAGTDAEYEGVRAVLDEQEQRELDHLLQYSNFFLYGGLKCATPAA